MTDLRGLRLEGGIFALAEQDTTLLFLRHPARADARALVGAAMVGSALGLVLGASYMAGGTARAAVSHARVARLATAAAQGYSETALRSEADAMGPGALAVARRHDPFDGVAADQRDYQSVQFATRLERRNDANGFKSDTFKTDSFKVTLTKAALVAVAPLRMSDVNPLAGARELDCLAAAVYYEARGEGAAGQAAVAQVVINRMRHPSYPHSICGVVFQGAQARSCQFSFACDGSMRRGKEPVAWRSAKAVAARALGGYVMATVGAATSFHTTGVSPGWSMMRVAQIGSHVFYGGRSRPGLMKAVYTPAPDAGRHAEPQPQLILASALTVQPEQLGMGGPVGTPVEPASAPKAEVKPAVAATAEKVPAGEKKAS